LTFMQAFDSINNNKNCKGKAVEKWRRKAKGAKAHFGKCQPAAS